MDGDGDVILPDPGGIDTVQARNSSWTLGAGLENLDLVDSLGMASSGTGNDLNNIIRSATEGGTLLGLGGDDLLIARHVANTATLHGGDGNDTLYAIEDDAYLFGDAGDDLLVSAGLETAVMEGGAGADTFRFASVSALAMISDFVSGTDKLSFDGRAFTAIGASGNFSAGDPRFFAGTAAHDADDRVIFDAATGKLYYDADGSGNGIAQLVATVQASAAAATVAATDIVVVDSGTPVRTPTSSPLNGVAVLADDEASHAAQSYPEAPPDLWFHW